jgi:drug/metabolite transporter (DMT)-like permease
MKLYKHNKYKFFLLGPIQMIFSAMFFSLMSYFAKLSTNKVSSIEVTFFRLLLGTITALVMIFIKKQNLISRNIKTLLIRGLFGGVAVLLFFISIEKGTLSNSVVLQNSYPIFAAVIAVFLLHERLNIWSILALIITFGGIITLVKPDIHNIKTGDMFAIGSAILGGFAITAVRQLRKSNESVWVIFFYFCFFGMMISGALMVSNWVLPKPDIMIYILLTGILGLIGQVSMTSSYKYCNTAVGGILSMTTGVFSLLLGVFLLSENISIIDITGVILIISGNIMVVTFGEKT